MISALKGKISRIDPGEVHIETKGGVIYQVWTPISLFSEIKDKEDIFLYTVLKMKDDQATLYGFTKKKERALFNKLVSISGVGGKTALSFISAFSLDELINAINNNDSVKLSTIPGVGKKTAQLIILKLTGKLNFFEEFNNETAKLKQDLISAMVNLGYSSRNVKNAVNEIVQNNKENNSFEILFKKLLKRSINPER